MIYRINGSEQSVRCHTHSIIAASNLEIIVSENLKGKTIYVFSLSLFSEFMLIDQKIIIIIICKVNSSSAHSQLLNLLNLQHNFKLKQFIQVYEITECITVDRNEDLDNVIKCTLYCIHIFVYWPETNNKFN